MKTFFLISTALILFTGCFSTKDVKKNEKYYQTIFCDKLNGIMEYKLKDKTRVDCLTDEYAIEVDWAKKWAEAVGQSLYYAHSTNRKPSIALIVSSEDERFIKRAMILSKEHNIKLYLIEKEK